MPAPGFNSGGGPSDIPGGSPWPSVTNAALPMGGVFYGSPESGAKGPGNTHVANEHSLRFRAIRTGPIDKISILNNTLDNGKISSRCDRSATSGEGLTYCTCIDNGLDIYNCAYIHPGNQGHYHSGSGGRIRLAVYPDKNGSPDEFTLMGEANRSYVPAETEFFPTIQLKSPANVVAGQLYHIVMHNEEPTNIIGVQMNIADALAQPRNMGAVALDGMTWGPSPNGDRFGPYFGNSRTPLYRNTTAKGSPWYPHNGIISHVFEENRAEFSK